MVELLTLIGVWVIVVFCAYMGLQYRTLVKRGE